MMELLASPRDVKEHEISPSKVSIKETEKDKSAHESVA